MLRINRVEREVSIFCKDILKEDIIKDSNKGISSVDICSRLKILRNNASSDLNKLYISGKLIKIKGKPTKYFSKERFEEIFMVDFQGKETIECNSLLDLIDSKEIINIESKDPFLKLIGVNKSLEAIINLGKASILYPNGLHTILLGESGVGKSLFAEVMYEYGVVKEVFNKDSSFVVFNCADYANNPNLLVAQLFGCKKGAYTGADKDREGLIEKANGGVLFLDEIHRLPPEGQEMLFLFIDKKKFRRLGETCSERTSKVLIIAATTENPTSTLLTTFIRRIPVSIKIPSLKERSLSEKLELVNNFFNIEAKKINKNILVNRQSLARFIVYSPMGNIGQLTSDIKLSVARAYLESTMNKLDNVVIKEEFLPFYTTSNCYSTDINVRKEIELLLTENEYKFESKNDMKINDDINLYDFVKYYKKYERDSNEKYSIKELFQCYSQAIARDMVSKNIYPDFIDNEIREIVSTLMDILFEELNLTLDKSSYVALALYFKNLRDNGCQIKSIENYIELNKVSNEIYYICKRIIKVLRDKFNIYCEEEEIKNFSIIINSLKNKEVFDPVGIIIVAHGESLATNIASIANTLLDIEFAIPIDMPLTEAPNKILEVLIDSINKRSFSRGLIIFADMGSLTNFDHIIKEKTNIESVTVNSINSLLVIEAIRKSIFQKADLKDILYDLIRMNNKLSLSFNEKVERYLAINKKRIIYTVCNTGEGVAFYLQQSLIEVLREFNIYDIEIMPINLQNKKQVRDIINQTSKDKQIIAILGSINPDLEYIPYIALEEVLLSNGLERLIKLLGIEVNNYFSKVKINESNRSITINISCDAVNKYLTILSAEKLKGFLLEFIKYIEISCHVILTNSCLTKLIIHMSCMIERVLLNDFLLTAHQDINMYINKNKKLIENIRNALKPIENNFNISILENEIYYIGEILKNEKMDI